MDERHKDEEKREEKDNCADAYQDDQKDTLGEYYRGISRCDD